MGSVIQMYASAVPAAAMASIDIPKNGFLTGVLMRLEAAASGADFSVSAQLSFGSTAAFSVNDARQVIAGLGLGGDLTTSGGIPTVQNIYVPLPDIPVGMGERLYLHGTGTAIALTLIFDLYFDFNLDMPSSRRR